MKITPSRLWKFFVLGASAGALAHTLQAADFVKADNSTQLNLAGSWTNGAVPGASDTMVFDTTLTVNRSYAVGGSLSVLGLNFSSDFQTQINQTGTAVLTLGSGGLVKGGLPNVNLVLNNAMALGADQTWDIQTGRVQMQTSSSFADEGNSLNITGAGVLDLRSSSEMIFGSTVTIDTTVNINQNGARVVFGGLNTFNNISVFLGTVSGGTIGDFGVASSFGDGGTSTAINLGSTANNGILEYTGNSVAVNRTVNRDARSPASAINVTTAGETLTFSGNLGSGNQINASTNGWAFGGAGNLTLNGVINDATGAGSTGTTVTKSGTGTLTLGGDNTYTGDTTVTAGSLIVNGTISTGILSVSSDAVLGGSGTIGGATTISGSLRPGNSIGTLTVNADTTWNGGDAWVFELGSAAPDLASASTGGSTQDLLAITGAGSDFLKGTGSSWTFDFDGTSSQGFYQLVTWDGTTDFLANDFTASNLGGGFTGEFAIQDNALYLEVVPEPSTYALLGLAALGLGAHVLRRRRKSS